MAEVEAVARRLLRPWGISHSERGRGEKRSRSRRGHSKTPRSRDKGKDPELKSCHGRLGYSSSHLPPTRLRRALQKAAGQAMPNWQPPPQRSRRSCWLLEEMEAVAGNAQVQMMDRANSLPLFTLLRRRMR